MQAEIREKAKENLEGISPEERHRMIAEAAYLRAEHRGFQRGDPIEDWLAAEAEIDRLLGPSAFHGEKEERQAHESIRRELAKLLTGIREAIDVETIKRTVDRAAAEVKSIGGMSRETVDKVAEGMKQEISSTAERMGTGWKSVSKKTADLIEDWLKRGDTFISHASRVAGEKLGQLRKKNGGTPHHTD
jgi:hypothetical protein